MHAVASFLIALVSTTFHGWVMYGPVERSPWPRRLLTADILAANSYGAYLSFSSGVLTALRNFGPALLLLAGAARAKRRGYILSYAWMHGTWHVLSAVGMRNCLLLLAR